LAFGLRQCQRQFMLGASMPIFTRKFMSKIEKFASYFAGGIDVLRADAAMQKQTVKYSCFSLL
jgi:hypothetical protein